MDMDLDRKLQLIFAVTLMGVMGVSLLSPVLPQMANHFDISEKQIGLVIVAFTLPGIGLSLFIGVFTDRVGRKKVLIPLLLIFSIAGVACGLAPDFQSLLFLRFLQGIGGAGLITLSTTLIGDYYTGVERSSAMGLNASILSIGAAFYPFIGGLLGIFGWSIPFYLYLIASPVAIFSLFYLEEPNIETTVSFREYLSYMKNTALESETLIAIVAVFLALILLYGGLITYFPIFIEQKFGGSSTVIGILQTSASGMTAIVSSQTGRFSKHFSESQMFISGFIGYGTGLILLPFVGSIYLTALPVIIIGAGNGIVIPNVQTYMTKLSPDEFRGATMSIYNLSLRVGMTAGPIALGIIYPFGIDIVFLTAGIIGLSTFFFLFTLNNIYIQ